MPLAFDSVFLLLALRGLNIEVFLFSFSDKPAFYYSSIFSTPFLNDGADLRSIWVYFRRISFRRSFYLVSDM